MSSITKKILDAYKSDRLTFIFAVLIICLGIFFRLYQYGLEGGLVGDSPGALAGGLKWYYPHDYFPGLMHTYPPMGGIIMGAGCMLSGVDFSPIAQLPQNFYPPIEYLIGEPFVKAENYCLAPSYLASILLLIGLAALSFSLLDKYSALYSTAFFAFFGPLIQQGRIIYYDIFLWAFVVYGVLLLWMGYKEEKGSKGETVYFVLAAALFGFGIATKYTAGSYMLFEIFIIFEKYSFDFFKHLSSLNRINLLTLRNPNKEWPDYAFFISLRHCILSTGAFLFAMLLPYGFSIKNFIDVKDTFFRFYPHYSKIVINGSFPKLFIDFLFSSTMLDIIAAVFSIYVFVKLMAKILNKKANASERYILYLELLLIVSFTISAAFNEGGLISEGGRRQMAFIFWMILFISLAFSESEYSLFNILHIKNAQRKHIFFAILSLYVAYSAFTLYSDAPYYYQAKSPLCRFNEAKCETFPWPNYKFGSDTVSSLLNDNETFYAVSLHMYSRQADGFVLWQMETDFQNRYGREPTMEELSKLFDFEGRRMRYVYIARPYIETYASLRALYEKYAPNKNIYLNGIEMGYVYDLYNLTLLT